MSDEPLRSRRAFFRRAGLGAASLVGGVVVARVARAEGRGEDRGGSMDGSSMDAPLEVPAPSAGPTCAVHDDVPRAVDAPTVAFLGSVAVGTTLGAWTVTRVFAPFRGALPFVLGHADGRTAQVDLLRHDAASPAGIAATTAGHLYLVNAGRGAAFTPAELEVAIHALARALDGRDGAALGLATFAERERCHPGGVFVVPVRAP